MRGCVLMALAALISSVALWGGENPRELRLASGGKSLLPISVDKNAAKETLAAAKTLADYIQKISGAKPEIILNDSTNAPERAIWVGLQPKLKKVMPNLKLDFQYPEEILLANDGENVVIVGRDRVAGDKQLEFGTVNAVYAFIEKKLGVRWLWPGELGEDVIKNETIALPPFEYRFHPVFRQRHFWPRQPRDWHLKQRLYLYSLPRLGGHSFTDWWDKYHETHPDYFALLPNGKRAPVRDKSTVKLCVSNPDVWNQWLDDTVKELRDDPTLMVVPAMPNDGPGHCVCERCRSWDHPDAPKKSLTERHVKFWNELAKGLRARVPDRDAYVGALAYAAYLAPPIDESLEKNIAIAYVGHFPLTSEENRKETKKAWKEWADKTTLMIYRPNLWYWAGGVWGFPEVAMKKTIEDFRFLADNKCVGMTIDSMRGVWSTQGPQYYLMAQLAYDPYQDGEAVMKDYYQRGFGPAAEDIQHYWTMMEDARDAIVSQPDFKLGSANRYKLPDIFARVYSEAFLNRADEILKRAEAKVADSDLYRRRVAFVRTGFDFTRLLIRCIPVMTKIRDGEDPRERKAAIERAKEIWGKIERLADEAAPFALPFKNICQFIQGTGYQGRMGDYFGPPSEDLINKGKERKYTLLPAKWTLAFSDDFKRSELGSNWKVLSGNWTVDNDCLITRGEGTIMVAKKFPGLQKVTFNATVTPNPGVSDISPFIQSDDKGLYGGYLLQFGGNYNSMSCVKRMGNYVKTSRDVIEPGKTHAVIAEYDGVNVRLIVDGKTVVQYPEPRPLVGEGHERVGLYVYEGTVKISDFKVYVSEAIEKKEFANGGEGEGFE